MRGTALRWLVLVQVAILVMVSASPGVSTVAAETPRYDFVNYNINCIIHSQTMWVEDGILHIRNRDMTGYIQSTSDTHEGPGHMVANANIDLATMYGNYWGTLEIYPDAYPEGHWAGSWSMQVTAGKVGGKARLQGYGELNGLATKADLSPLSPTVLANYAFLCNGSQPISGAYVEGFYMDPGGE